MEQNVNSGMQGVGLLMIIFSLKKKSFYVIYIFLCTFFKVSIYSFCCQKKIKKREKKGLLSLKHFLDANTAFQNYLHQFFLGIGVIERQRQVGKKKRIKDLSFSTFHLHPRRADWLNFVLQ